MVQRRGARVLPQRLAHSERQMEGVRVDSPICGHLFSGIALTRRNRLRQSHDSLPCMSQRVPINHCEFSPLAVLYELTLI